MFGFIRPEKVKELIAELITFPPARMFFSLVTGPWRVYKINEAKLRRRESNVPSNRGERPSHGVRRTVTCGIHVGLNGRLFGIRLSIDANSNPLLPRNEPFPVPAAQHYTLVHLGVGGNVSPGAQVGCLPATSPNFLSRLQRSSL